MFKIEQHVISSPVLLAPMAGTSDTPFRILAKQFGVGLATSEMLVLKERLLHTLKSKTRLDFSGEPGIISMQIAATTPNEAVEYALHARALGADIIDINMGCPAKKVCKKFAGSALLANESLVAKMLSEVVRHVDVPITLKTRIGIDKKHINIATIARIAQDAGVRMIAIHGRTKADKYSGEVDYRAIKQVVDSVDIPVIANGDITTPQQAKEVLDYTGANGVMIGRAVCGQPWILQYINEYLQTGNITELAFADKVAIILAHIKDIHAFYPEHIAKNIAKKHIKWYLMMNDLEQHWGSIAHLNEQHAQYEALETILTLNVHHTEQYLIY